MKQNGSVSKGGRPEPHFKDIEIKTRENSDDFKEFDDSLNDKKEFAKYKTAVERIGGTDFGDHTKKAMQRCVTNKLMATMNMSGKKNKTAFGETNFFKILKDVIVNKYGVTEQQVTEKSINFLKWAPERVGGGGRNKNN